MAGNASPMPKRVVVVVAENVLAADTALGALTGLAEDHAWHRIARDGCTVQLLLEEEDRGDDDEQRTLQVLRQLLGLARAAARLSSEDEAARLRERYPRLKLGLLSSSPAAVTLATALGWSAAPLNADPSTWPAQASAWAATIPAVEVVAVHARATSSANRHTVLVALGDVVNALDGAAVELIVVASHAPTEAGPSPYVRLDQLRAGGPLLPRQSFETVDGVRVTTERFPLLAAYHLDGHSRRDRVQAFTEADIGRNAGLGAILAYHFFPEVAYWLGHANKYGA